MAVRNISVNIGRASNVASLASFGVLIITKESVTLPAGASYAKITSTTQIGNAGTGSVLVQMINDVFNSSPGIGEVFVLVLASGDDVAEKLTENNNGDWFGVLFGNENDDDVADIKAVSDWVQSNSKFFYCTLEGASETQAPAEIRDSSDTNFIGSNDKTAIIVHTAGQHPEAPHLSRYLARGIGLSTPAPTNVGARLSGKTSNAFSISKNNDIVDNNGNVYIDMRGIERVNNSLSLGTSGQLWSAVFEDAWLEDRIEADLDTFFLSRGRTSYDDAGITAIADVVSNSLRAAGERNIVDRNSGNNPDADYQPTDGDYRFGVVFPTRAQVEASNPDNIVNNRLEADRIWYYKAGNITNINLTILYSEV